ncbi:uncharacterized protein [Miscanthus floridulus]|uniref:uncharacterized protein n=1 Tax=Miscanthus floridulus TaxID=154761 RepID=UPI0034581236
MNQAGEEGPTPHEAEALELGEAKAPSITEATKGKVEAPRTSKAEVVDARAPKTTEAEEAEAGAPGTTKAEAAEAGLGTVEPVAKDVETEGKELANAKATSTVEQLALTSSEGLSALVWSTARTTCEALEVTGVESGSSLGSCLIALSGRVHERLWGVLHTGVKHALAIVSSHYTYIDLKAVSDGYVMAKDDKKAEEEVMKLVETAKAPSTVLAKLFEEEVVPPTSTAEAGDPEL